MKISAVAKLVWPLALLATLHIAACNGDSAKSVTAKNDSDTSSDDSANDDSANDDSATSRNDSAQEQFRVCPPSADEHAKMATDAAHYIADEGVCEVGYTCVARGLDGERTVYGCVEKPCGEREVLCGDFCVDAKRDVDFCGAGRYCKDGKCLCRGNQLWCDAQCINPHTHSKFCGAKGRCAGIDPQSDDYKGVDCGEDAVCEDGTCRPLRCQANETLCEGADAVRRCVDLNTDMAHCGQCGWACADRVYGALKAESCSLGECQHRCEPDPEVCKDPEVCNAVVCATGSALKTYPRIACYADVHDTAEYCGGCSIACDAACYIESAQATCQPHLCEDANVCHINGCISSDIRCGRHCVHCAKLPYAASAHCSIDEGKCIIDACVPGFYPNDDASVCLAHSPLVCATADGAQKTDCTSIAHAASVECLEGGACRVHQCESGYHINDARNACVANAPNACGRIVDYGDKIQDCSQHAAANGAQCLDAGTCQVTKCDQGYHVSADQRYCLANTDRECGAVDSAEVVDCLAKGSMYACVNGACVAQ